MKLPTSWITGLGVLAACSHAQALSTHPLINVSREISPTTVTPGQIVRVTLTAAVGALGTDKVRGFFLSDHLPVGPILTLGAAYVNGVGKSLKYETSAENAVYAGCRTSRWVLETPPAWVEAIPLPAASNLRISYTLKVPNNANPGTLTLPGASWVGMIVNLGDSGDNFGYEDLATSVQVVAKGTDSDSDGMPDAWETAHGLNPSSAADASTDLDSDGLSNLDEYLGSLDPQVADSDSDGMPDGWETNYNLDPSTDDAQLDADGDQFDNQEEFVAGTDPIDPGSTPNRPHLFFDDFTDGDWTTNPTWTVMTGSWSVADNILSQTELVDNRFITAGESVWTDYRLEMRFKAAGSGAFGSGPMFRVVDENNLYLFEINVGLAEAVFWKRQGGSWTNLLTATLTNPPVANTWYSLAITANGSELAAFIDSQKVAEVSDTAHPAGRIGINAGDLTWFDEVSVSSIEPNQPPTVSISAAPTSGEIPLSVTFTADAQDPDGTITLLTWDFGDGESGTGPSLSHNYLAPGTHVITVTATDDAGASQSATTAITAFEPGTQPLPKAKDGVIVGGCTCRTSSVSLPWSLILLVCLGLWRKRKVRRQLLP